MFFNIAFIITKTKDRLGGLLSAQKSAITLLVLLFPHGFLIFGQGGRSQRGGQ